VGVPAISFAIPYYENPAYLREAIDSIRAQTHLDWELVVVDDTGPEPVPDLVAGYDDSRITYVRNETNRGLSGNWNECIRQTRGPMVTLLHADDRLLPTYAERVLEAAASRPHVAAVFTDVVTIGAHGRPGETIADFAKRFARRPKHDHDLSGDAGLAPLLAGNYILCPTLCLRREVVGEKAFDQRWRFVPDWDFTSRQLLTGHTLHSVRAPLLEYRRHQGSQTSALTSDASRFVEEIQFLQEMALAAGARGWHRSERAARRRITVRGHLALRALADLVGGHWDGAREKLRILGVDLGRDERFGTNYPDPQ